MMFPFRKPKTEAEAPQLSQSEQMRARLADCEAQIEAAECDLRAVSLDAALSDDPQAGEQALRKLADLRGRKELLEHALAAALQREADAAAADKLRDHQARRRAAAQHAARLEKASKEITQAQTALIAGWGKAVEAAQALVATLPPHMRTVEEPVAVNARWDRASAHDRH